MKTISFPVGYRPHYLQTFLEHLKRQNLEGWEIFCSAENCPPCIEVLKSCGLNLNILYKANSIGRKSHAGARDNMFNVLNHVFKVAGSDFNVHFEDDFLLAPDALDLANWYYNTYKDKPLSYITYGLFGFAPRGDDYSALEEVDFFEGLGWCTFKEGWDACFSKCWYDDSLARKYFGTYGWDWAVQGFYREYKFKSLRPLINRTQHNGRIGGTCASVEHHDKHYAPLKWNTSQRITEFKLIGTSEATEAWVK